MKKTELTEDDFYKKYYSAKDELDLGYEEGEWIATAHYDTNNSIFYLVSRRVNKEQEYWQVEGVDTGRKAVNYLKGTRNIAEVCGQLVDIDTCKKYELVSNTLYYTKKGVWVQHNPDWHCKWRLIQAGEAVGCFLEAGQVPPDFLIDSVPESKWL